MSPIILKAGVVLSSAMLVLSLGCSDARTPKSLINPDTGKHDAGWESPDSHGAVAKAAAGTSSGIAACQECHADNFIGGISNITCLNTAGCHGASVGSPHSPKPWRGGTRKHTNTDQSNAPVCALCHTNGANSSVQPSPFDSGAAPGCFNNTLCHADVRAPHAVPYTDAALHGPAAKADLTYCQACHSDQPSGGAGSNPRFNVAKGSLATGCEGASCHATNMAHPLTWRGFVANDTGHMTAGNKANACVLCHGANLDGVGGVGPSCLSCHKLGSPLTLTNCTSCHGNPPNGSVYPNAVGKHSQHIALGSYIVCAACHNGGGTGTANHDNGNASAFVAILSSYNAKSGAASYNATTNMCSNVSCHGGQTTPSWLSGTVIDVNTQCTSCHASGTDQYNSYHSGQHSNHVVDAGIACYTCHDTTLLAMNHFTSLNTTALEGPASATIAASLNYTGVTCTPACHSTRTW
jgi:predicted CxxxxCH...CXXCH cytochrome family protein